MIKLPKDWQDKIQLRDFMQPVNKYPPVAILLVMLVNKDRQVAAWEQEVELFPNKSKVELLDKAYQELLYRVPAAAAWQDYVKGYYSDSVIEPITNNEWSVLIDNNLKLYKA